MKVLFVKRKGKNKGVTVPDHTGGVPVFLSGFGVPAALRALAPDYVQWIGDDSGQLLLPKLPSVECPGRKPPFETGMLSDGGLAPGASQTGSAKKVKRSSTCIDDLM